MELVHSAELELTRFYVCVYRVILDMECIASKQ